MTDLVSKWVCASFFQPSTYLDTGFPKYDINPAHVACGGIDTVQVYFYVALITTAFIYIALVLAFTITEQRDNGVTFGVSVPIAVASGALWPVTTFAAPTVLIALALRAITQRIVRDRKARRLLREAIEARRIAELRPYMEEVERDLACQ